MSGIFRDVYLIAAPNVHLLILPSGRYSMDTTATPRCSADGDQQLYRSRPEGSPVELVLLDDELQSVFAAPLEARFNVAAQDTVTVDLESPVKSPRKWSAEDPYLYTL